MKTGLFCTLVVLAWSASARADAPDAAASTQPSDPTALPAPSAQAAAPPSTGRDDSPPAQDVHSAPNAADLDAARHGYQFGPGVSCPFCEPSTAFPRGHTGLHWHDHWRSVGLPEYVLTPLLGATAVALQFAPPAKSARWDSPILFDSAARKLLRLHSASARKTAESVSNVLFVAEVGYPVLVDPLLMAWAVRKSPSVAWQMSVINAQAYGLTLVLNQAAKRLTSRKRPYVDQCDRDPTGASCGSGSRYQSFYSGHTAVAATGAGLICAHHTQLSLYQNAALDTGTCVAAVLGTAVTGVMRLAADNHWASDVLVGHLMGYLSGYLLPTLLYYKEFRSSPHEDEVGRPVVAALPIIGEHSLQLGLLGVF